MRGVQPEHESIQLRLGSGDLRAVYHANEKFRRVRRYDGLLTVEAIDVTVVTTYLPAAFDAEGNYNNASESIFTAIANAYAPNSVPARR